tara:strand:+ start:365 stop:703 length:339 start_codon:yes stop_codon:yes gene_type:complete
MANAIKVSVDADKAREILVKSTYTTKDGREVEVQKLEFELIEKKDESKKVVYDSEKFQLVKTHFAVKPQTKEERAAKAETVFVGEGTTLVWKDGGRTNPTPSKAPVNDDLPF